MSDAGTPAADGSFVSRAPHDAVSATSSTRATMERARPAWPRRSAASELLLRRLDFLVNGAGVDRVAVAGERACPRRDGIVDAAALEKHVAVVILDDGIAHHLIGRALETLFGEIELVGFVIRPAEAVEI